MDEDLEKVIEIVKVYQERFGELDWITKEFVLMKGLFGIHEFILDGISI